MNRRTFFKGVAALCCAPIIPALPRKKSRLFLNGPIAINLDGTYWPYDEESLKALSIPLREVIFTKENLRIFEKC